MFLISILWSCNSENAQSTDLHTNIGSSEHSEEISTGNTNSIDWPAVIQTPRIQQNVDIKDDLEVPVLLLEHPPKTLVSDNNWYTATYAFPDYNVVIGGKRIRFDDHVLGDFQEPTRSDPRVTSTHYIVDATFVEWGVSYTVSIECNMPHMNPKCTGSKTILNLVNELLLVESPALLREAP